MRAPCQAVAIRYVHDVATGEFLNIGLVVLCPEQGYAGSKFLESWSRVTAAFPGADPVHLRRVRDAVAAACATWTRRAAELPLGLAPTVAGLVYEALPRDDASVVLAPPIRGVAADPERLLRDLFARHVGRYVEHVEPRSRDDGDVWRGFERRVRDPALLRKLTPRTLVSEEFPSFRVELDHAWKNGTWHAAYPFSLDLTNVRAIQRKAAELTATFEVIDPRQHDTRVTVLIGLPGVDAPREVRRAAEDGTRLVERRLVGIVRALPETQGDELVAQMERDLSEQDDPSA